MTEVIPGTAEADLQGFMEGWITGSGGLTLQKGKLSKVRRDIENKPDFMQARRQHSAVESGINALEVHGLDRCPDRGLDHFKRYVALAVVGRNLQKLGAIL
uniref:ISNCY family transposase n=1 Tax=uncultured Thiotrichaceae bacterium TaxID=298394 RepID=A0A6S6SAY6_9GAMM|nr:MAG: ISNCY family transposase [uncultured Thiotrichaceae bacterium]